MKKRMRRILLLTLALSLTTLQWGCQNKEEKNSSSSNSVSEEKAEDEAEEKTEDSEEKKAPEEEQESDDSEQLEEAEVPNSPSSPNIKRNTLIGFLTGGALISMVIIIVEVLDDRVKKPEDVEEALGITLLGVVPNMNKL